MTGILVQALVGVYANGARLGQANGEARTHPVDDEVLYKALAHLDLRGLTKPSLRDIQHQQDSGDQAENAELVQEFREIVLGQCIVERLVPVVELDLPASCGANHHKKSRGQRNQAIAHRGGPQRLQHHARLWHQAAVRRGCGGTGYSV